ncbi:MAG: TonB-dependent receptor plug domain-containing protein [Alphaproteobacteria bacterium]
MRGLNPAFGGVRTLLMVDTRRFVPTTAGGAVDLNQIPSMLIRSTEVVTGGASAQYGTDALAGVVNILLDHNLTGFKAQLDYGQTFQNDGENWHGSFATGTGFAGGRGHVIFGAEFSKDKGIGDCGLARDWCAPGWYTITNDFNNGSRVPVGNIALRGSPAVPPNGLPRNLIVPGREGLTILADGNIARRRHRPGRYRSGHGPVYPAPSPAPRASIPNSSASIESGPA